MNHCMVAISLAAGNFFYQAAFVAEPAYRIAAERSFFQVIAIMACLVLARGKS